jgi:hypothetical protein
LHQKQTCKYLTYFFAGVQNTYVIIVTVLSFLLSSSALKEGHDTGDSSKVIPGHDQQGMLKTMLKRTSLRHWMRKESSTIGHGSSDGNDHTVCKEHSLDAARFVT